MAGLLSRTVLSPADFIPKTAPDSHSFPCWQQPARSVELEEDTSAGHSRPAFIDLLSSHTLLCRKKRWGVEIYSDCLVLCSGLTRFMPGTQRRPVGGRDVLCRWHTELIFYDAHVSAAWSASLLSALNLSSVTFGVAALLPLLRHPDREDRKEEKMSCQAHIFRAAPILTSFQMCTSISSFF